MNDFEKINTDLATLFREGRALLDAGNSAVMNGCREEAFRKFVDLGGIPNKQEDYIYQNKYNIYHLYFLSLQPFLVLHSKIHYHHSHI